MNQKNEHPYIAVELIYISPRDGAQQYEDFTGCVYWLDGIDKAKDVNVGDKGYLHYERDGSRGYFRFVKEKK